MIRKTVIIVSIVIIVACSPKSSKLNYLTETAEMQETMETTPIASHTPMASLSATPTSPHPVLQSTETSTFMLPPGAMSYDEIQLRVDEWINEKISFKETDRLLDEDTGEPLRLGLLVKRPLDTIFIGFNLGLTVVRDERGNFYVINIVGFEDGQGQRFTFPFHSSSLTDTCTIIHLLTLDGKRINHQNQISFDKLTPRNLLERSSDIVNTVAGLSSQYAFGGTPESECQILEENYIRTSARTVEALADFLACEECTQENAPYLVKIWMNTIPQIYDAQIPYLRIYNIVR